MTPPPNGVTLLTPPGAAAIAVVRLRGEGVRELLTRHFSGGVPGDGRCVHGTLRDERGETLDDPVVVCSAAGTIADVNLHGGAWVVRAVLNLAERAGFEFRGAAAAPEVTCAEAASEIEREVLAHLPNARTELALRTLLAQPAAWAEFKPRATHEQLQAVLGDRALEHLLRPPRVAIVGAPNVGKSTLANQLFAQERSITADLPGTTRDWVGEVANVDGLTVMLVDTPGVRETNDAIEREAIERSGAEVARADLVVLVLDVTRPIEPEQGLLLRRFRDAFVVANKVDRPGIWDVQGISAIPTVASIGEGVDRLREAIRSHFGITDSASSRPLLWTERQRCIVTRALSDPDALREI